MARTVFDGKFFRITHTIEEEGPHPSIPNDYYDDSFSIMALIQGGGICHVEGNCYRISDGDIIMLGLDEIHSYTFEQEGYHERLSFYFSSSMLSPLWEYELPLLQPFCSHIPGTQNRYGRVDYDYSKVSGILSEVCQVLDNSQGHPDCVQEAGMHLLLLQLLFSLYDAYEKFELPPTNHISDSVITDICKYIHGNLAEKLTYQHLQDKFLVSRYQLTEVFQRNTGMTLTEYIIQKRLVKVTNLVRNGMGIERAAFEAGFQNYSHFYKDFVKRKNISPRKYYAAQTSHQDN